MKNIYGYTLFLNLLSTEKEDEEKLSSLLLQCMRTRDDKEIRLQQYDFHKQTAGEDFENATKFI